MDTNDKLKEINIKNHPRYFFDDVIKTEGFDFDNILIEEKCHMTYHAKLWLVQNYCILGSIK